MSIELVVDPVDTSKQVQNLKLLVDALDKLKGSGTALSEMRKMLVGIKGQGSALDEIRKSADALAGASGGFDRVVDAVNKMRTDLHQELMGVRRDMLEAGVLAGKALTKGVVDGAAQGEAAVVAKVRSIATKARKEATAAYQSLVGDDAYANIAPSQESTLYKLMQEGANLSNYHKRIAKGWADSHRDSAKEVIEQLEENRKKQIAIAVATLNASAKAVKEETAIELAEIKKRSDAFDALEQKKRDMNRGFSAIASRATAAPKNKAEQENAMWSQLETAKKQEELATDAAWKAQNKAFMQQRGEIAKYHEKSMQDELARQAAFDAIQKTEAAKKNKEIDQIHKEQADIKRRQQDSMFKEQEAAAKRERGMLSTQWNLENKEYLDSVKGLEDLQKEHHLRWLRNIQGATSAATNQSNSLYQTYNAKTLTKGKVMSVPTAVSVAKTIDPMMPFYEKAQQVSIPKFQVGGDFSPYNAKDVAERTKQTHSWSMAFKKLGDDMGYAHSSARGLASGFGLLWLTWGAMAPMFAGAGISHGLMEVARSGMAVEQSFAKIRILSNETAQDVQALNSKMLELARSGITGPAEIAEAMKVMSLAGLKASDVYESVGTVMNFAIAGDTSIEKSADVLTGVAKAFKLSAQDYNYVADIISVAAATSKSSVESMGEAFKTSSVVHSQYGASLKDVALVQAMLANVQVTGTAAGTATRNMLSDLTGRTPKAVKALKELGMSMKDILDENGKIKPLGEVFTKMLAGLDLVGGRDKFKLLRDIFTERGEKGGVEMLDNIRKEAEKAKTTYVQAFKNLQKELDEAAGFTIISAAKMSLTAQNEVASVTATLKASLTSTFETMRPYLITVARELKAIFGSEEFKDGVKTAIVLVGGLTQAVVENGKAIAYLALSYLAFKGVAMFWGAAVVAVNAYKTAVTGAAAAQALLTKTPVGLAITGLAVAIGSAAAMWELYSESAKKSAEEQSKLGGEDSKALLDKLVIERERLEKVVAARKAGVSLMEYELKLTGLMAKQQANAEVLKARKDLDTAKYRPETIGEYVASSLPGTVAVDARNREIRTAQNILMVAEERAKFETARVDAEAYAIKELRKVQDSAIPTTTTGNGIKNKLDEVAKGVNTGLGYASYKDDLSEIDKEYTNQTASLRRQLNTRLDVIKAFNAAGLKSDADTAKESYAITLESEKKQQALLNETNAKRNKFLNEEKAKFGPNYDKLASLTDAEVAKIQDPAFKSKAESAKSFAHKLAQEAEKQRNDQRVFDEQVQDRINAYSNTYLEKIGKGLLDVTASNDKLQESNDKLAASESLVESFVGMRSEQIAGMKARNEVIVQWADELTKADRALANLNKDIGEFETLMAQGDTGATINWFNAMDVKDRLEAGRTRLKSGIKATADKAEKGAYAKDVTEQYTQFANEFKTNISDAMSTAIFEGGAEGGKKLRNYLQQVLIQRPFKIILEGAIDDLMGTKSGGGSGWLKSAFKFLTGTPAVTDIGLPSTPDSFNSWELDYAALGGRASGGTVKPGGMYRVNEQGIEMLSVGGKDYLMNGAQQGRITPAGQTGATVTYAPQINIDSRADQAQVYALVDRAVKQGNAKLVDDLKQARVI